MSHLQVESTATPGDFLGSQHVISPAPSTAATAGLDIRTLSVALAIYGGYFVLTWYFQDLPLWVAAPLLIACVTWHGSLQHETIHGHPTPSRRLNVMLATPPLSLWIPYRIYRATHLQHHRHRGRHLTEVSRDPESFFLQPGTLSKSSRLRRALYTANCTLSGRLILGPAFGVFRFWTAEARKVLGGDRRSTILWSRHALAVAAVLLWTRGVCHIPIAVYVMLVVYPSISLNHLRSFTEHRAAPEASLRTMVVEAHPLWALIFLNNNLHIAHHAHPQLPWHQLPRAWSRMRGSAVESGLVYDGGYGQVAGNFLLRPVISVEHPGAVAHAAALEHAAMDGAADR
jgi:fatty acid desaturase